MNKKHMETLAVNSALRSPNRCIGGSFKVAARFAARMSEVVAKFALDLQVYVSFYVARISS